MHNSIPQQIKAARKAAGLTQQQLADKTGLHKTNISRMELNKVKPGLRILELLAVHMNCEFIIK